MPVTNIFFGPSVTVSGLLTGGDILSALSRCDLGQHLFLPQAMFDESGRLTLDDLTVDELAESLGVPISLVSTMSEVVADL